VHQFDAEAEAFAPISEKNNTLQPNGILVIGTNLGFDREDTHH
jgi:hypothetical protein